MRANDVDHHIEGGKHFPVALVHTNISPVRVGGGFIFVSVAQTLAVVINFALGVRSLHHNSRKETQENSAGD